MAAEVTRVPQFINQKNEAMNTSFSVAVILLRVYAHIIKPVKREPDGYVPLIKLSTNMLYLIHALRLNQEVEIIPEFHLYS